MATNDLTEQRLRDLIDYNPDTGLFTRRVSLSPTSYVGQVVGHKTKRGELRFCVDGKPYKAHRLAWLYMTGRWPSNEIDHVDGNPLNNKFANLREATGAQNKQNFRRARADNSHGFLGVYKHANSRPNRDVWCARITVGGKCRTLGLFDTPEAAHAAYIEAKRQHHPFGTL
jgi:hypothetical protein